MTTDTSAGSARPEVLLHIGMPKTGTSSLQQFCRDNEDALTNCGVFYPRSLGNHRHYRLGLFLTPAKELESTLKWNQANLREPRTFHARLRRSFLSEVGRARSDRILLSDEALYAKGPAQQQRLKRLLGQFSRGPRVILYLRRQDDHMISRYQQQVKQGLTLLLSEYVHQARRWKYDYYAQISAWRHNLEPTDIIVRCFDPERLVGGSLYADFFDATRIDVNAADLEQPATKNSSLDAESVEFLRLLNLYQVDHRGATPGNIDNRVWVRRAQRMPGDRPTLTLPAAELDAFMALWDDSNHQVAERILGRSDGRLFRERRDHPDVRTEQRLEPHRLDAFFEALEIPEEWHRPIRLLHRREERRR